MSGNPKRHTSTDAEKLVAAYARTKWEALLAGQIDQLFKAGKWPGTYPVREHRFAKSIGREWRFDFACIPEQVAAEVEGGIWTQGRHTRGSGFEEDCRKYAQANLLGWTVFRFTSGMILRGEAVGILVEALTGCAAAQPEAQVVTMKPKA